MKCKECGTVTVASNTKSCPNCGMVFKKTIGCFTYILVGVVALIIISVISTLSRDADAPKKSTPLSTVIVSYGTIQEKMNSLTSVQWDAYRRSIIGATLSGNGWVVDVKNERRGLYTVILGILPPLPGITWEGVHIKGQPATVAGRLNKKEKVRYYGRVVSVEGPLLLVTLRDGAITTPVEE